MRLTHIQVEKRNGQFIPKITVKGSSSPRVVTGSNQSTIRTKHHCLVVWKTTAGVLVLNESLHPNHQVIYQSKASSCQVAEDIGLLLSSIVTESEIGELNE